MKFSMKGICLAAVLALSGGAASAAPVYSDAATDFNGQYRGVSTFDVDFSAPGGTAALSFDLFGANSVDGFGNGWDDLFTIALNGVEVFKGYFSMSGGGSNKVILNTLGWAWNVTDQSRRQLLGWRHLDLRVRQSAGRGQYFQRDLRCRWLQQRWRPVARRRSPGR